MRMLVAGSAVAMLLVPPSAGGQPTAPVAPRAIQRTTVAGTAPPIEGRSLVLVHLGAGTGGAGRELAVLWDVGRGAGGLEVVERFVLLPEPQQKALQRGRWQPSPADLRAIAQAWDDLRPETRGIVLSSNCQSCELLKLTLEMYSAALRKRSGLPARA